VREAEWLACTDLMRMEDFLRGRDCERKVRLFACASARRVWGKLTDQRGRTAVEVAERYADGLATPQELGSATRAAILAANESGSRGYVAASYYVFCAVESVPDAPVCHLFKHNVKVFGLLYSLANVLSRAEEKARARLLRDIFNPFHAQAVPPSALTPDALALAQAAYDERELPSGHIDATRLAVLADALEEAGCDQADLLGHLRRPGPHVRGCWVVDLLLGKE
jgi:hypothetical protein